MFTLVLLLELSSRRPCIYTADLYYTLYAYHASGTFCRSSVWSTKTHERNRKNTTQVLRVDCGGMYAFRSISKSTTARTVFCSFFERYGFLLPGYRFHVSERWPVSPVRFHFIVSTSRPDHRHSTLWNIMLYNTIFYFITTHRKNQCGYQYVGIVYSFNTNRNFINSMKHNYTYIYIMHISSIIFLYPKFIINVIPFVHLSLIGSIFYITLILLYQYHFGYTCIFYIALRFFFIFNKFSTMHE